MTKRRPLALGAAATIGFGSLFFAAPALADEEKAPKPENELKVSEEATAEVPVQADEQDLKAIDSAQAFEDATGGEAVAVDTAVEGGITLLVSKDKKTDEVVKYAEAAAKGQVEGVSQILFTEPAVPYATTDVVGGAGYIMDVPGGTSACSIGFPAWGPDNAPALISAGHCTGDGSAGDLALSKPSTEPAVGGEGYESNGTGVLGQFGFYRFGGPGDTAGADEDPASTDISVIDVSNEDLQLHGEVTNWTTAAADDLAAGTVEISGVADPTSGDVSKSGRTTGFTSGDTTVTLEDAEGNPVEGEILDGWIQIGEPGDARWVHGFINDAGGAPGDSGGAVIQGNTAVGLVSGGPEDGSWMWATRLNDALAQVEGDYEVAVHVDAPTLESPNDGDIVEPGSDIVLQAPANADSIGVSTAPNTGSSEPVDENGQVVLQAPTEEGPVTYTVNSQAGKSSSESLEFTLEVKEAALAAPAITSPEDNSEYTTENAPTEVSGTGVPGATVSGSLGTGQGPVSEFENIEVDSEGNWTAELDYEPIVTDYTIQATQTNETDTSNPTSVSFSVAEPAEEAPDAPTVDSINNGDVFGHEDAPTGVSGTGVPGAEVDVTLAPAAESGQAQALVAEGGFTATVDAEGNWTAEFGEAVDPGAYQLAATQTVEDLTSEATTLGFEVTGADNGAGGDDEAGSDDGDLANTGGTSMLPYALGAVLLLGAGGAALLIARRKTAGAEL